MFLLRKPILALSGNGAVRDALARTPVTKSMVDRFVPGETSADAVRAVTELRGAGLQGPRPPGRGHHRPGDRRRHGRGVPGADPMLTAAGQVAGAELSVKLSAVGQALLAAPELPAGGNAYALAGAKRITDAAYAAGAGEPGHRGPHHGGPDPGGAVRAPPQPPGCGHRRPGDAAATPKDLAKLTGLGSRVRLVKGAYDEPADDVAYTDPEQIDLAYVRAMKYLMHGKGYPMIASHDPRLVAIADKLASDTGRTPDRWGAPDVVRDPAREQRRLVAAGKTVRRVYVPYEPTGTATSPGGWPNGRRTCCSSCARWRPRDDRKDRHGCRDPSSAPGERARAGLRPRFAGTCGTGRGAGRLHRTSDLGAVIGGVSREPRSPLRRDRPVRPRPGAGHLGARRPAGRAGGRRVHVGRRA